MKIRRIKAKTRKDTSIENITVTPYELIKAFNTWVEEAAAHPEQFAPAGEFGDDYGSEATSVLIRLLETGTALN